MPPSASVLATQMGVQFGVCPQLTYNYVGLCIGGLNSEKGYYLRITDSLGLLQIDCVFMVPLVAFSTSQTTEISLFSVLLLRSRQSHTLWD